MIANATDTLGNGAWLKEIPTSFAGGAQMLCWWFKVAGPVDAKEHGHNEIKAMPETPDASWPNHTRRRPIYCIEPEI